jgi:hypothetical protein
MPAAWQRSTKAREVARLAESGLRRVLAEDLIAPGATERMPHDRQQLDVGEAQRAHMRYQLIAELIPVE